VKKRLLFISTIFPSRVANTHATYNVQILKGLTDFYDIDIINPIPWPLGIRQNIPPTESLHGMEIFHPTYWYVPRMLRRYYGVFYYSSIKSRAVGLIKKKGYDVILSSWLYPDGWAATKLADSFGIPSFVTAIGTDVNKLVQGSVIANHALEVIERAKKIILVSENLKKKVVSLGANQDKLIVLYSGVNRDFFKKIDKLEVRHKLGFSAEDKLVLFVGNFLKTKGLDELADAFKGLFKKNTFKKIKLVMTGSGKYEPNFINRLKSAGVIDRVVFTGSCALPDVAKLMNAADVVCLPSYSEGLPNVVLEALCCNAKVVATNVGGIPELKKYHKNLYLVPPKNTQMLTETLMTALNAPCHEDLCDDIGSWRDYSCQLATILNS